MTVTLSRRDTPGLSEPYTRQDIETDRWVAKAWRPDDSMTRSQLLTYAQNRIAELTSPTAPGPAALGWEPVHSAIASFTMSILNVLVSSDDVATPQVAPTPEGGLNVEWLVSGDSLSVTTDLVGLSIVAQFDNGDYAFEPYFWDFDGGTESLIQVLTPAARFLEKISRGIQHRLPIR
jgi:hypothetical protein